MTAVVYTVSAVTGQKMIFLAPTAAYYNSPPEFDGIFVMDSYGLDDNQESMDNKTSHISTMLARLRSLMGLNAVAVVCPGGSAHDYLECIMLAQQQLHALRISPKVQWVVLVSMGNEFYNYSPDGLEQGVSTSVVVSEYINQAVGYVYAHVAYNSLVVYGGESKTWGYPSVWGEVYDHEGATVVKRLRSAGRFAIRGMRLGPRHVDRFGHIRSGQGRMDKALWEFLYWAYLVSGDVHVRESLKDVLKMKSRL